MLDEVRPAGIVSGDQAALLKRVEPTGHRPPPPPSVKDRSVAHDVLQMFGGRIRHGVELMKRVGAAHPAHCDPRPGCCLREIGILPPYPR